IESNSEYSSRYKEVLNKNIKNGNGYVSLERIIYLYLASDNFTFDEIYTDNLDLELKKQKPINDVCLLPKYSSLSVCKTTELLESGQINEEQIKPFNPPLDVGNLNITSFFKEERIVYDKYDIHTAWDFSSNNQTKVYSVCEGTVETVSFKYSENVVDTSGGGGNEIKVKCEVEDLTYYILYAHLYPNSSLVKTGDKVNHFQEIASVGTTGYSTGPHLHYEVSINGNVIDGLSLIDFTMKKEFEKPN
ncbi:MAG: M23 family metallopeptidase, partial [Bacilli bacterium]